MTASGDVAPGSRPVFNDEGLAQSLGREWAGRHLAGLQCHQQRSGRTGLALRGGFPMKFAATHEPPRDVSGLQRRPLSG